MRTTIRSVVSSLVAVVVLAAPAKAQLVVGGQVGFRSEYMANENFAENDATRDDDHRLRWRARVRIQGQYAVSERFNLGFRLSTGSSAYPSSGWSSLSDDFRRDDIMLDRAYIGLAATEELSLTFGFTGNALFRPTELVWDSDVSPGGFTEVWRRGGLELVAGQYMLREVRSGRSPRAENSFLFAEGISYRWGDAARYRLGVFSYVFTSPNVIATAVNQGSLDGDYRTNRTVPGDPGAYFSDYEIVGASFTYQRGVWGFASEVSLNLAADKDAALGAAYSDEEGLGWTALVTYGTLTDAWSWNVTSGFFHIEADATIAAYNSDDVQQTNVRTVPLWVRVQLPGGARLVWDTYVQSKIDVALPSNGGIVHPENARKVRTRLTLQLNF